MFWWKAILIVLLVSLAACTVTYQDKPFEIPHTVFENTVAEFYPNAHATCLNTANGVVHFKLLSSKDDLEWISLNISTGFYQKLFTTNGSEIIGDYHVSKTGDTVTAIGLYKKKGFAEPGIYKKTYYSYLEAYGC